MLFIFKIGQEHCTFISAGHFFALTLAALHLDMACGFQIFGLRSCLHTLPFCRFVSFISHSFQCRSQCVIRLLYCWGVPSDVVFVSSDVRYRNTPAPGYTVILSPSSSSNDMDRQSGQIKNKPPPTTMSLSPMKNPTAFPQQLMSDKRLTI